MAIAFLAGSCFASVVAFIESKGIKASGYEDASGLVVCKGSGVVKDDLPSIHRYMAILRNDLLEQGVIVDEDGQRVFSQDQVFTSPTTAAGVVLGRNANGRIEWKTNNGTTLKELQAAATSDEESADD